MLPSLSVAVVDREGSILFNHQKLLDVKKGERGLRQSDAFFQHEMRLPYVIEGLMSDDEISSRIGAVSCSARPRPVTGSYMPVFNAGSGAARMIASSLKVPMYEFSHQEGHIEAVKFFSDMKELTSLICFHFSGGTTEAILVDKEKDRFEIVGGSRDISYGQVLDRVGVALGFDFPCGEALDDIAFDMMKKRDETAEIHEIRKKLALTKIKSDKGYVNLSGIETQAQSRIKLCAGASSVNLLIEDVLHKLSDSILRMTEELSKLYGVNDFLFAGGVSCSRYVRAYLNDRLPKEINTAFGKAELSSDNAIGIALLGGKKLWLQDR